MSELKSRRFFEAVPTSKEGFYQPGAFVDGYLKSDADKVIARHKRKRCLAMAAICSRNMDLCICDTPEWPRGNLELWKKRKVRWLELAEEPTWAKFLQLIHKECK